MLDRVAVNEEQCGHEVARLADMAYNHADNVNFARLVDEHVLGGVIYTDYTGESIAIHVGSKTRRWINRDMLWITFDYPFNQLNVRRIFGYLPEDLGHQIEFDLKIGFRVVNRIDGIYPNNIGQLVLCMEREECRFLNLKPRHVEWLVPPTHTLQ